MPGQYLKIKEEIKPEKGYFVRDFKTDTVVCPSGAILRKKCKKSNGYTRYMNKSACSRCESFNRCYHGKRNWKEIDFPEGAHYVMCRNWVRE